MFKNRAFHLIPKEDRVLRQCLICSTEFTPNSGVHKYCSVTCKGKAKYIFKQETTDSQYARISGNWQKYITRLINRSHQRDQLKVSDILELLEKQNYLCALSGIPLTCTLERGKKFKTNLSLDRIDAGGPYIKENIQLVCAALNSWRSDTDLAEFIWFCKKVADWQEG